MYLYFRLQDIRDYVGNEIDCVLVATKCNASSTKRVVTSEDALAFAHKKEMPFVELSSFEKRDIDRVFKILVDLMLSNHRHHNEKDFLETTKLHEEQHNTHSNCVC